MTGWANSIKIYIDENLTRRLNSNRYIAVKVGTGEHIIESHFCVKAFHAYEGKVPVSKIVVEPGQKKYFLATRSQKIFHLPVLNLSEISEESAQEILKNKKRDRR